MSTRNLNAYLTSKMYQEELSSYRRFSAAIAISSATAVSAILIYDGTLFTRLAVVVGATNPFTTDIEATARRAANAARW